MSFKRNVFANYVGTGVVALAPLIALPYYLAALGPEQFGLISFVVMLQALLGLFDAGVSQSLTREFSMSLNGSFVELRRSAVLLHSFERVYWIFALFALSVALLFANPLAENWLKLDSLNLESGQMAVYGAAAIFAAQFPGSLYRSLLVGAQAQIRLNLSMVFGVLLKHIGGVLIISEWPTLLTYLTWFTFVTLMETFLRAAIAWHYLGGARSKITWSGNDVRRILPLVLSVSVATLLGALTIQMDKIILSRMVSVDIFGYYSIAWSIAIGALQLIYPILNAALPKVIRLQHNFKELRLFSAKLTGAVLIMLLIGGGIFFFFGHKLLGIWLKNPEVISWIYLPLSVLLVGTAMHAIWNIGYLVWLAKGKVNNAIFSNSLALIMSITFTPILINQYGLVGAAFGWLLLNLVGMLLSFGWVRAEVVK